MIEITKKILSLLKPDQKKRLFYLFFAMLAGAVLETISVALVVPMIQAVLNPELVSKNRYIRIFIERFFPTQNGSFLSFSILALILIYVLKNLYMFLEQKLCAGFSSDCSMRLKNMLAAFYLRRHYEHYLTTNTNDIYQLILNDTSSVVTIIQNMLTILTESVIAVFLAAAIFVIDPIMTVWAVLTLLVVVILILAVIRPRISRIGNQCIDHNIRRSNWLIQGLRGIKEIKTVMQRAENNRRFGEKTIVFVDEIHRFNKGQQDYLLPFVEDGTIILIGATTENPYFEVNGALLSRSSVFELRPLSQEEVETLILRAVQDEKKGMGSYHAVIEEDALHFLADLAGGDARSALNAVELGILTTPRSEDGMIHITLEVASECIQKRVVRYDKTGDNHYDTISAFIKSMRGSDPDAAVYYLAKMLYAGEDIKFIARRIMICASEDVGNADPMALNVAVSAAQAVERIGMPEAQIILSQAVLYVATAPKSNSACNAVFAAMDNVKKYKTTVPVHLQDAHYKGSAKLGHGIGYKYAHDYPNHYVKQQYLPDEIKDAVFYEASDNGYEQTIKAHMKRIKDEA